ncbi:site-2 protease family protein [Leeia sp. TBRC 13508]|uniref:Site-2 protease family protein n=1 Tax=Leeia speluncae TaxID=2884804 RepID=A0ABS8DBH2_9NEIS|nr:site-2 protease family protein [Leeia speluncae]MCB6185353.1 site-2 protease family protein [Leeia speluncae]
MDQDFIRAITLYALPIILAITLHEAAHGWVAYKLGDRTAYMMGRITANPLKHIDLVGTIILPLVCIILPGGFLFGWAKPVPVNTRNFKNIRRDMLLVAAAGPLANILMMLAWLLFIKLTIYSDLGDYTEPLRAMATMGVLFNTILAAFNLIPLPPLDGGRIVTSLLPYPWDVKFGSIERFGFFILIALMATGMLNFVLGPIYSVVGALQHLII